MMKLLNFTQTAIKMANAVRWYEAGVNESQRLRQNPKINSRKKQAIPFQNTESKLTSKVLG